MTLPHRQVVAVSGPEALLFLQGLVTQDMTTIPAGGVGYGCLLTAQGKFLHDLFLWVDHPQMIRIDCERSDDLIARLAQYRLRRPLSIERLDLAVLVSLTPKVTYQRDPRHPDMGFRALGKATDATDITLWDRQRMRLGIPDGSRDAEIGVSTLEELNIPRLNGVSFTKGCYVGQELTARVEHRGLAKKHLRGVQLDPFPVDGASTTLTQDGQPFGPIRSTAPPYALMLLRDDRLPAEHTEIVSDQGVRVTLMD